MTVLVGEDISQFVVDDSFQADFETDTLRHTLLLSIDHNHTRTDYTSIYNFTGMSPTNVDNPIYGQPIPKPSHSNAFYDHWQKTY